MEDGSLSDVQKAVQNNIKLSRFVAQEIKNSFDDGAILVESELGPML